MKTIYNQSKNLTRLSPLAGTLIGVSILSALYYAYFIIFETQSSDFILYCLILFIEFYVISTSIFAWWTIMYHEKEPLTSITKVKNSILKEFLDQKVIIIITVYTESLEIVEKSIIAAKQVMLCFDVYVGDDSNRPEVKALAQKYGVKYVTRTDRKYFKSGNISNVLKDIQPDYVAIFDVDHIPSPEFIVQTLPYFSNKALAFVQTPQYYTNIENVISRCASGSQNIFYELIMPGKNSFNSAFCVGTNVIFRYKALEETFPAKFFLAEHSEDIWISLKLHQRGWKSIYIPKVLAKGLAPDNIIAFFKQQERWARGGYEIFLKSNPLLLSTLNPEQKIQYFFSSIHYFSGFVILIYLILPIMYLLFGIKPMHVQSDINWLVHFLPFFASKFILVLYLMSSFDVSLISGSFALFPVYIKAFFKELFRKDYDWVATNTNKKVAKKTESVFDYIFWHIFFLLLSVVAIFVGFLTFEDKTDFIFASFWTLINSSILIHFIYNGLRAHFAKEVVESKPEIITSKNILNTNI